jgi:hypothetical protein
VAHIFYFNWILPLTFPPEPDAILGQNVGDGLKKNIWVTEAKCFKGKELVHDTAAFIPFSHGPEGCCRQENFALLEMCSVVRLTLAEGGTSSLGKRKIFWWSVGKRKVRDSLCPYQGCLACCCGS